MAFGLLGISRREFYEMRPGEFWEALRAYNEQVSADRRHLGELVRGATIRLWNLQVAPKSRLTDVRKFWPMPWDEEQDGEAKEIKRLESLDEEQAQKEIDKFLKRIGKHGKRRT